MPFLYHLSIATRMLHYKEWAALVHPAMGLYWAQAAVGWWCNLWVLLVGLSFSHWAAGWPETAWAEGLDSAPCNCLHPAGGVAVPLGNGEDSREWETSTFPSPCLNPVDQTMSVAKFRSKDWWNATPHLDERNRKTYGRGHPCGKGGEEDPLVQFISPALLFYYSAYKHFK